MSEYSTEAAQQFQDEVMSTVTGIADMLIEKNKAYGDSALNPIRVFSKASTVEQLRVRADDKLSRIARGHEFPGDNDLLDLAGYIVLLLIASKRDR
ncbi:MAG: hypothetical protein ACTH4Y_08195 [Microbacterium gubbeenense]|uniref:hypothetical protein n=1 Tax=Microbacterium gubbeenense TaxID=159896 RepID=UPI003F978519